MPQFETAYRKLQPVLYSTFTGLCIMIILCGCPYHSIHKIDTEPQLPTEESYLGNWIGSIKDETYGYTTNIKMLISKKNDTEYNFNFIGFFGRRDKKNKPIQDTIVGNSFMSIINSKLFMNIEADGRVYIAEFKYENDQISLLPLAENFTNFIIQSDAELRYRIGYHYKTRLNPSYDESFCLRNMRRE